MKKNPQNSGEFQSLLSRIHQESSTSSWIAFLISEVPRSATNGDDRHTSDLAPDLYSERLIDSIGRQESYFASSTLVLLLDHTMKKDRELQLLVCSANLGNQQPDDNSLAAWIPEDGRCTNVLVSPQTYPIRTIQEEDSQANGYGYDDNNGNNGGGKKQAISFDDYESTDQFDIIVIGLQESTFDIPDDTEVGGNGKIRISVPVVQPMVNKGLKSFQKAKKAVTKGANLTSSRDHTIKTQNHLPLFIKPNEWSGGTTCLHGMLGARLPSYERIVSFQRGEMRLEVFVNHQIEVKVLRVAAQNTGFGGLANKGGIVTELLVNGTTRLSFLTAHLEAHEGASKYAMRCGSLANILGGTGETSVDDVTLTSHFSFVMGDLNFRTELQRPDDMPEEDHKARMRDLVSKNDWSTLNEGDELRKAIRQKDCLVGFQTLFCNFPPTFKVERRSGYTYIEKRRPSYTDRVLWKTGHELEACVRPLTYEPIDTFASSDHKPIRAAFAVDLNGPYHLRPRLTRSRRRSIMDLRKRPSRGEEALAALGKDRLQLFVSQIHCLVNQNEYGSEVPPNPYVCLRSFPEFAVRHQVSAWMKFKKRLFFQSLGSSFRADGSVARYASGWPRTSRRMGTFDAKWAEEDIVCEINTHARDGSSVDLAGAMLRITVMDYNSNAEDAVLGTFSFNLVNLLRACTNKHEAASRQRRPDQGVGNREPSARDASGGWPKKSDQVVSDGEPPTPQAEVRTRSFTKTMRRLSNFGRDFKRKQSFDSTTNNDDDDPIEGIKIDEPLFKNGRETGRVQCEIEAWWMTEETAKIVGTSATPANGAARTWRGPLRRGGRRSTRSSRDILHGHRQSEPKVARRKNISLREIDA
jgi:hypothetical protein